MNFFLHVCINRSPKIKKEYIWLQYIPIYMLYSKQTTVSNFFEEIQKNIFARLKKKLSIVSCIFLHSLKIKKFFICSDYCLIIPNKSDAGKYIS